MNKEKEFLFKRDLENLEALNAIQEAEDEAEEEDLLRC